MSYRGNKSMLLKTCILFLSIADPHSSSHKTAKSMKSMKSNKMSKSTKTPKSLTTHTNRVIHTYDTTTNTYDTTTTTSKITTLPNQSINSNSNQSSFNYNYISIIIPAVVCFILIISLSIYSYKASKNPDIVFNMEEHENNDHNDHTDQNNSDVEDETLGGLYEIPNLADYLEPQPMATVEYDLAQNNNNFNRDTIQNTIYNNKNTIYDHQYEMAS
jgi:hypothetical protein